MLFLSVSKGSASDVSVSGYIVTGLGGVSILNLYNLGIISCLCFSQSQRNVLHIETSPGTKSTLQGQSIKILKGKPVFPLENSPGARELAPWLRAVIAKDPGLIPSILMEVHHVLRLQARMWCTETQARQSPQTHKIK